MYGCGCWAYDECSPIYKAVASSTSGILYATQLVCGLLYIHCISHPGTGEYIIKTLLARECAVYGYNNCCIDIKFTDAAPSIYSTRVVQLQRETFTQP